MVLPLSRLEGGDTRAFGGSGEPSADGGTGSNTLETARPPPNSRDRLIEKIDICVTMKGASADGGTVT